MPTDYRHRWNDRDLTILLALGAAVLLIHLSRRYSDPPPEILIVIGFSREFGERYFESCDVVGRITNKHGVANEETTDHPEILLCRHLRGNRPEFRRKFRRYG